MQFMKYNSLFVRIEATVGHKVFTRWSCVLETYLAGRSFCSAERTTCLYCSAEELQNTFGSRDCPKSSSVAIALTKPIIASRPFQSSPAAMSSLLYGGWTFGLEESIGQWTTSHKLIMPLWRAWSQMMQSMHSSFASLVDCSKKSAAE